VADKTPRAWRVILALLAAVTAAAAAPDAFVGHFKAATEAHGRQDYARMESELREALKLRPGHPTATYNLAAAQALGGRKDAALETLDRLVDMGLAFDPGKDRDFDALKDDGAFKRARRGFERNREPRGRAERVFRLRSPTFIPEGIAFDPDFGNFYVGSVHERRIQRVTADDEERDFIAPNPGLWAVFGMAVDRERELLWVATSAVPQMKDAKADELGRTALVAYALRSGKEKHRFEPKDAGEHQFGDVIVLRDGTLYATDTRGGRLYSLDVKQGALKALTPAGALASPQGLVASRDGRELHVADYTQGLFRYEIDGGKLERLEVDPDICVYGIDGLYRHGGDLIAIQNGIRPHRVVRLELGNRGRRVRDARVLLANHEDFDEPTLGVVVDKSFYFIANSQWGRFDKAHQLPPRAQLRRPLILRVPLAGEGLPPGARPAPLGGPEAPGPGIVPCVPPLC
jgi:hypothetical protein